MNHHGGANEFQWRRKTNWRYQGGVGNRSRSLVCELVSQPFDPDPERNQTQWKNQKGETKLKLVEAVEDPELKRAALAPALDPEKNIAE